MITDVPLQTTRIFQHGARSVTAVVLLKPSGRLTWRGINQIVPSDSKILAVVSLVFKPANNPVTFRKEWKLAQVLQVTDTEDQEKLGWGSNMFEPHAMRLMYDREGAPVQVRFVQR